MAKMSIPDIGNIKPDSNVKGGTGQRLQKVPTTPSPAPVIDRGSYSVTSPDSTTDYGGGYGGGGGYGIGEPSVGGQSDVDYLAGDSPYQSQLAALMKALSDYRADSASQGSRYDVDYGKGLKALGWNDMDGDFATAEGEWDLDDPNTAAGRGFTSQRNDFASRGMLQSSDYGRANDLLMRNLNDQRGSMETGRNRFTQDLATQLAAFENENNAAQQSAKQEALLRRAAPYTAI